MKLTVDNTQRLGKMRAHTATHLLHHALGKVIGQTKQAGSLVQKDFLRFDFSASQPLETEQLQSIEACILEWIAAGYDVTTKEMSFNEAKELGAKAFFEDKYGDEVRVVSIINHKNETTNNVPGLHSVELCGGTHVHNTAHIGAFIILSQEAVASGIRRITAVTGPKVAEECKKHQDRLSYLSEMCQCQPKQLEEKLAKIVNEKEQLATQIQSLQVTAIREFLSQQQPHSSSNTFTYTLNISGTPLDQMNFKDITTLAKSLWEEYSRVIYTQDGTFALSLKKTSAKEFLGKHGLRGGGSDHFVQGKDKKITTIMPY